METSLSENRLELRLGQFLKLANMVGSGGEAKIVIQEGLVRVNGEVETRRGRHLKLDDIISYGSHRIAVKQLVDSDFRG